MTLVKKKNLEYYIKRNIINETIASQSMRDYLIQNIQNLSEQHMAEMICKSPIQIQRKVELCKQLHGKIYRKYEKVGLYYLNELSLKEKEVFCLNSYCVDKDESILLESRPFYSYEAAMQYLKENYEDADLFWHVLEKWVLDTKGNLQSFLLYEIIKGKLCYVYKGLDFEKLAAKNIRINYAISAYHGMDMNLPVPFKVGDIITVDSYPFYGKQKILIIEVGDNQDCCCLQGLYNTKKKKLGYGAVKHNSFFKDLEERVKIPALYQAEIFRGGFSGEEIYLQKVAEWIKKKEENGKKLWGFLFENSRYGNEIEVEKVMGFIDLLVIRKEMKVI